MNRPNDQAETIFRARAFSQANPAVISSPIFPPKFSVTEHEPPEIPEFHVPDTAQCTGQEDSTGHTGIVRDPGKLQ